MLYYKSVSPKILGLLKKIRANNIFNNLRLVGGTALALQIGHRKSVDIDLFGEINLADDEIKEHLNKIGKVKTLTSSKYIKIYTIDNIKVDIVKYPYPWIYDPIIEDNPVLAHILDIVSMKLSAITNRGTKKDFIDIYFLLQNYTLKDILRLYEKKYPDGSVFFVLKSLVYFEDAENEPMPEMFTDISWEEVKNFIVEQTKNY